MQCFPYWKDVQKMHVKFSKIRYKKVTVIGCILFIIQSRHFNRESDEPNTEDKFSCLWPQNQTRKVENLIHPSAYTTLINPIQPCTMPGNNKSTPFLLVMVQSAVSSFSERNIIRNTWAKEKTETDTKVFFLLGQVKNKPELQQKVENEALIFNDIVQEKFMDNWTNLTVKSLMMLKWFNQNCNQTFKFLMKADEDVFVNLPLLTRILEGKHEEEEGLLMGNLRCNPNPAPPALKEKNLQTRRRKTFKHVYPPDCITCRPGCEYRQEIKPLCLDGTAYVMNAATAKRLYSASLDLQVLAYEDIFVTGILAKRAGIRPTDHPGFRINSGWYTLNVRLRQRVRIALKYDSCPVAVEVGNDKLEQLHQRYRGCRKYRKVPVCKGSMAPTKYCQVICNKIQSRIDWLKPPLERLN